MTRTKLLFTIILGIGLASVALLADFRRRERQQNAGYISPREA